MEKNSRIIWAIVLILGIGVIYKILNPKKIEITKPPQVIHQAQPETTPQPVASNSPTEQVSPLQNPTNPETDKAIEDESPEAYKGVDISFKIFKDPICMSSDRGIINVPSFFLRQFFADSKTWIALPKSYASCLQNGVVFTAYFYDFDVRNQFPFRPLVKMNAFVESVAEFPTLSKLKDANEKASYQLKIGRRAKTDIYAVLGTSFSTHIMEPWVQVTIVRNSIENKPSFWPNLPPVHPIAKIISKSELPKGNDWVKNYTILDVRPPFLRKKFALPFPAHKGFNLPFASDRKTILNAVKLQPDTNKFLFKKDKQTPFLIIGHDQQDLTAYNAANFLALAGFTSITIVKEGAEGWGAPATPNITVDAQAITPQDLHRIEKQARKEKKQLIILDCRSTRESSHGSVANAITIPFKPLPDTTPTNSSAKVDNAEPAESTEDNEEKREMDIGVVEKKLQSLKIDILVVYGRSQSDDRSKRRAKYFIEKLHPAQVYELADGFQGWQFFSAYQWVPEDPKAKKSNAEMLQKNKDLRKFFGRENKRELRKTDKTENAKIKQDAPTESQNENAKKQDGRTNEEENIQNREQKRQERQKQRRKSNEN